MIRKVLVFAFALGAWGATTACSSQASDSSAPGAAAPAAGKTAAAVTPQMLQHGRGIYKTNCAPCHGEGGKGDGPAAGAFKPAPADHTDPGYMGKLTDEDLAKVIQMGGVIKGKPAMPSNPQIRDADLAAVVAFTRSLSTATP